MKKIFYCKKCNSTWSGEDSQILYCPDCNTPMIQTNISAEEWRTKSDEQKEAIKNELKEIDVETNQLTDPSIAYLKSIAKDVHFMRSVLDIVIVISLLGIFISFVSCMANI